MLGRPDQADRRRAQQGGSGRVRCGRPDRAWPTAAPPTYQALTGVPTVPMVGLLAAADAGRRTDRRAAHADRRACRPDVDRRVPVGRAPLSARCATCDCWTPWTSSASPTASSRCGEGADAAALPARAAPAQPGRPRPRHSSAATGAEVRYRRVRSALVRLRALAAQSGRPALAEFLSGDDAVIAVMAAAVDVVQAAGLTVDHDDDAGGASAPRACTGSATAGDLSTIFIAAAAPTSAAAHCGSAADAVPRGGPVTDVDQQVTRSARWTRWWPGSIPG